MKLKIVLFLLVFWTFGLPAQLTGNKYIPGDYSSIGEAVDSLNLYGVGNGGVNFNIQAGYVESDSIPPITSTGTASNPIIFQKDGVGNNPLIEFNNTANSSSTISPFRLIGADFITFQELSFESLLVHTGGSVYAIEMDGGFSSNDGCQNNTIQDCEFINTGILLAISFYATGANGVFLSNEILNNEVHIYSSTTQQSIIVLANQYGSLMDQNTKIIGNSINDQVSLQAISTFIVYSQDNFVFKDNTINYSNFSGSSQFSNVIGSLVIHSSVTNPTIANKINIENNSFNYQNISLSNHPNSRIRGIETTFSGITYDSLIIRDNHFTGVNLNVPFFRGIFLNSSATTSSIHDNTFSINSSEGGLFQGVGTSGTNNEILISENEFINFTDNDVDSLQLFALGVFAHNGLPIPPSTNFGNIKINDNLLNNIETTSSSGNITGIFVNGQLNTIYEFSDNIFSNFSSESDIFGIKGLETISSESIQNNQFHDFNANGNIFGIHNESYAENSTISGNEMYNFNSTGIVGGMLFNNQDENGIRNIANNEIYNLESDSSIVILDVNGGNNTIENNMLYEGSIPNISSQGDLIGLAYSEGEFIINNNQLNNLSHQGGGNIFGINGTDSLVSESIQNNQLHDFTANGNVYGIYNDNYTENSTILDNQIYNFNSFGKVGGIYFNNQNETGTRTISDNEIYNLESDSSIVMLEVNGGNNTLENNMLYEGSIPNISSQGDLIGLAFSEGEFIINNNQLNNLSHQGGGNIFGINGTDSLVSESIQNNQFHDFTANGNIFGIHNESYIENSTISDNQMYNFSSFNKVGGVYFDNQNETGTRNIANNEIYNLESDSSIVMLEVNGGNNTLENNILYEGLISNTSSQGDLIGLAFSEGDFEIYNTEIYNLLHQGSGVLTGISSSGNTLNEHLENNLIYDLTSNGTATGIELKSDDAERNIEANKIFNIIGQQKVFGVNFKGSTTDFRRNKIYDIQSDGNLGESYGIFAQNMDSISLSNNLIGNITAPFSSVLNGVIGIGLDSLENALVYYNSVVLSGENNNQHFGSSAIYLGEETSNIDLRNNIFVNKSQASGSGLTVGLRMEEDDLSVLSPDNDNNLYFVDTTENNAAFFYDGINTDYTFNDFKLRMSTREQNSVMEDVLFESLSGNSVDFLRPSNTIPTFIESNAQELSEYKDDYHFLAIRTNYPLAGQANGGGEQPDIGAVEGDYIPNFTSVANNTLKENQITIYPNPVVDQVFVQTKGMENYQLTITDVNGKVLLKKNVTTEIQEVDVSGFAKGVYVFSLSDKILKQKKVVIY